MKRTRTGNERELQLVNRYLEEHFNPIRRLLEHKTPDLRSEFQKSGVFSYGSWFTTPITVMHSRVGPLR